MEHKIIPSTWKTKDGMIRQIKEYEAEGWSVSGLGEVFGSIILVMIKGAHRYEHDVVPVMLKTRDVVKEIIEEREQDGWQVCAIGEHFGGVIMILKRLVGE